MQGLTYVHIGDIWVQNDSGREVRILTMSYASIGYRFIDTGGIGKASPNAFRLRFKRKEILGIWPKKRKEKVVRGPSKYSGVY